MKEEDVNSENVLLGRVFSSGISQEKQGTIKTKVERRIGQEV